MADRTRVLVAAGDDGIRAQVGLTLGEERFDVEEATDTAAAVHAVADQLPALAIVDLRLPGDGALALLRTLRSQPETAAITSLLLVPRGHEVPPGSTGIDATLATPTTSFALLRKVDGLLEQR